MGCDRWQAQLDGHAVDEMAEAQRREYLFHLQECASCRRTAAEADPTLLFSLLPEEKIEEEEVEEIRRTVQAVRRVRALEASWSRRGLAAAGLAAMVLIAVVLIPQRPQPQLAEEVPFAGAVGVGSGLVTVPQASSGSSTLELQVELARSEKVVDLSRSPDLQRLALLEVVARPGEVVERDLGHGYRIRFSWSSRALDGRPILENLQLLQRLDQGEISLLDADLQPVRISPLILGVPAIDSEQEQLWLLLTPTADGSVTLVSEN